MYLSISSSWCDFHVHFQCCLLFTIRFPFARETKLHFCLLVSNGTKSGGLENERRAWFKFDRCKIRVVFLLNPCFRSIRLLNLADQGGISESDFLKLLQIFECSNNSIHITRVEPSLIHIKLSNTFMHSEVAKKATWSLVPFVTCAKKLATFVIRTVFKSRFSFWWKTQLWNLCSYNYLQYLGMNTRKAEKKS